MVQELMESEVNLVMLYLRNAKKIADKSCFVIGDTQDGARLKYPSEKKIRKLWKKMVPKGGKMEVTSRKEKGLVVYIPVGVGPRKRKPFLDALQAKTKPAK